MVKTIGLQIDLGEKRLLRPASACQAHLNGCYYLSSRLSRVLERVSGVTHNQVPNVARCIHLIELLVYVYTRDRSDALQLIFL